MFILQAKIYYLSKKYKPKSLHKIQNYILTSKDAKIFAVKQTLTYTSLYYKIHNKEVYRFNDLDKTLLYNSLLNTTNLLSQDFFLVESVKKYLVFLCMSPEWQAKFEPQYKSSIYASRKCYFQHRLSSFFNKVLKYKLEKKSLYISQCTTKSKYFDIQYLIKKLNTLPVISKYLKYWLNHQSLAEPSMLNTNFNEWTKTPEDKLNTLLNKILCNGSKWFSINYIYSDSYQLKMLELVYSCNSCINLFTTYINKFQIPNTYVQKQYVFNQLENFKIHLSNKIVPRKTNIIFKIFDYIIKTNQNTKKSFELHQKLGTLRIFIDQIIYIRFLYHMKDLMSYQNKFNKLKNNSNRSSFDMSFVIKKESIIFFSYYYPLINMNNLYNLMNTLNFKYLNKSKKKCK